VPLGLEEHGLIDGGVEPLNAALAQRVAQIDLVVLPPDT
jgi:hypothetical protein